jgi:protein-disulfide isomerase
MLRLLLAVLLLIPLAARADTLTRQDVEEIVRSYLLENPEVLEEAFTALQAKRQGEAEAARVGALEAHRETLLHSPLGAVIGNPDGDVTLVEFFDYNCGYCRKAMDDLEKMVEADPNLRVVLKELPVLGEASTEAAAVSIAVHEMAPERYDAFHRELMGTEGAANGEVALEVAGRLGLPVDDLRAAMRSERVEKTVRENYALAQALGLTGTPSYVIGDAVEFGAVGAEVLTARINEARCGAATC